MIALTVRVIILLAILYSCSGCAALTEEQIYEREDRMTHQAEVWDLCFKVHLTRGWIFYHVGHSMKRRHHSTDIRSDIRANNCQDIWRQLRGV